MLDTPRSLSFDNPRAATEPPEARGLRRDQVRLVVASTTGIVETKFHQLAHFLNPGDLVVVNTSATMPAAVDATLHGQRIALHFSTRLDDGHWVVELRHSDASGPILDAEPGDVVAVADGSLWLDEPADNGGSGSTRLWRASVEVRGGVRSLLAQRGRAIRYGYVPGTWPLHMYQTMFADPRRWPGSAEMPSAGRPFTAPLVRSLRRAGVALAGIELHTGVSSQESHEPPQPERFAVSRVTAARVNATRLEGGRIIAVGTTVTRALETSVQPDGAVAAASGWTDLVLAENCEVRAVDGIISGWHPPEASHLDLLRAVAGTQLVGAAYDRAVAGDYLWHEFGDSCLLLRD